MSKESEFYIPSDEGHKLHSRLHIPPEKSIKAQDGSQGVFVICHGLLDTKYAPLFTGLQNMLPFVSVAFDFRGNGHSTGSTNYGNYYEEADDIKCVVEYINNGGLDQSIGCKSRVVGIIGHSKGGSSVFLSAYKYQHMCPPLIINISARFWLSEEIANRWKPHHLKDLEDSGKFLWRTYGGPPPKNNTLKAGASGNNEDDGYSKLASVDTVPVRDYWVTREHLWSRNHTDMAVVQALPLSRIYVLNVYGGRDRVVPERDAWEYDRLMRLAAPDVHRVVTKVVPDASHFWSKPTELDPINKIISSWLDSTLPMADL